MKINFYMLTYPSTKKVIMYFLKLFNIHQNIARNSNNDNSR